MAPIKQTAVSTLRIFLSLSLFRCGAKSSIHADGESAGGAIKGWDARGGPGVVVAKGRKK
jgi:hypothetical protein